MTGARLRALLLTGLSVGALLGGCSDSAPEPGAAAATASQPSSRKPSVVDTMVAAVSAGKSSTKISVHFALGNAPVVGTELPVDVAIVPHVDFVSLHAFIDAQAGLRLVSGKEISSSSAAISGKPLLHKIVVMPEQAGVYMIIINLETAGADGSVSRIFSIPVIVSPKDGASAAPAVAPATAAPAPAPAAG